MASHSGSGSGGGGGGSADGGNTGLPSPENEQRQRKQQQQTPPLGGRGACRVTAPSIAPPVSKRKRKAAAAAAAGVAEEEEPSERDNAKRILRTLATHLWPSKELQVGYMHALRFRLRSGGGCCGVGGLWVRWWGARVFDVGLWWGRGGLSVGRDESEDWLKTRLPRK